MAMSSPNLENIEVGQDALECVSRNRLLPGYIDVESEEYIFFLDEQLSLTCVESAEDMFIVWVQDGQTYYVLNGKTNL